MQHYLHILVVREGSVQVRHRHRLLAERRRRHRSRDGGVTTADRERLLAPGPCALIPIDHNGDGGVQEPDVCVLSNQSEKRRQRLSSTYLELASQSSVVEATGLDCMLRQHRQTTEARTSKLRPPAKYNQRTGALHMPGPWPHEQSQIHLSPAA
jgi:hypothetical protein